MIRSQFSRTRAGGRRLGVAEDVRVARDELRVDRRAPPASRSPAPRSCEEQREEVRLEEQVAELVEQLRVVAGERRVRDLVRLLDRVRDDRARGLLAVPRALAAQALGQLLELDERVGERHRLAGRSSAVVVVNGAHGSGIGV